MPDSRRLDTIASSAAIMLSAAAAGAQDLKPAVCAVEQAIACPPFEPCERSLPGAVNLPMLMRIEPEKKMIVSRLEEGGERQSEAHTVVGSEVAVALQGVHDGKPWAMRIERATGRFTLASAGSDTAFSAFGVCSTGLLE